MRYDSELKKIGMEIKWKYLAGRLYTLSWEVGDATLAGDSTMMLLPMLVDILLANTPYHPNNHPYYRNA